MAQYYVDEKGNVRKKRNKDQYLVEEDGDVVKLEEDEVEEAIAPLPSSEREHGGKSGSWDTKESTYATGQKEEERTWFQKSGAFDDGFSLVNLGKAIAGTADDIRADLAAGVLGIGEGVVDAGATLIGGIGKLFGADGFANTMSGFVEKNLIDEEKVARNILGATGSLISPIAGIDYEETSVLGNKSDSLVQSGGQLLGQAALQSVGVPWWVTSGITSFGSSSEEAFKQGASYGDAVTSAAISAGAEILTEKLFGGSGLGEKGLINVQAFTSRISSKGWKLLFDYGIDVLGEGAEEVASEFFSTLGQQLTYEREETWEKLLSDEKAMDDYLHQVGDSLFGKEARERYAEAAIGGAVLGGIGSGSKAIGSIKKKTDYQTGLNANEEAVFNQEYQDRIKEAEKGGKKLSSKEKGKIYDEVMNDLEKGYISTDAIEKALGGETYKAYRDTVDSEDALQREYDQLGDLKESELTVKQRKRLNELEAQLENVRKGDRRNGLRTQLDETMRETVKGSRLAESYNEQARRGEAFTADLSKYNEKQKAVVQKAIDSGILNNTNRTHEFVDIVSKIAADKGVLFDFTNNAKLKESGFAIDGKTVNGYITKDGITINMSSAKAWQSTVGHEITHVLEGTELYTELQTALFEYAKTKGDYQKRYDALVKLYQGIEGADVNAELAADLVGDYLFTDSDFVNNLSAKHRNVFQKIYDEIKYLWKVTTAGTKEARELEKVKHNFERAFRESTEASPNAERDVNFSISKDIENSDNSWYNEIKLPAAEQARVQSEALTWHTDKRNQLISQTLSNEITYRYMIDDDGIVHIYEREAAVNIHELGEDYGNTDTAQPDTVAEELWTGQGDNSIDSGLSQDGRKPGKDDTNDHRIVSGEWQGDGTGYSKDGTNAYGRPKKTGWHFNEDGSTDVTYSDGTKTKEDIAPKKEVSSTDDAFFDGGSTNAKFSLSESSDETYSRVHDMRVEANALSRQIEEYEKSDEYKQQLDRIMQAMSDDMESGVAEYQKWLEESGYGKLKSKRDALREEADRLAKDLENSRISDALSEEKAAIEKSGLSEAEYFRKQAVKEFGYTPHFYDAGYITPNGKMLNFSGEKGKHFGSRGQDHRAIGTIYAETQGTDALNRFVRDGNIRIMAESPGLDMSTIAEPTKEQYATIRKFAYDYAGREYFNVDFTDESGKVIGSLTYENRINPTRIINDIKHFYETGEIRQPSTLDSFRYSLSEDSIAPEGEVSTENGSFATPARDLLLENAQEDVAPVAETVSEPNVSETVTDDLAPLMADEPSLAEQLAAVDRRMVDIEKMGESEDNINAYKELLDQRDALRKRIADEQRMESDRLGSLTDADAPPEVEAPYADMPDDTVTAAPDPFENRDMSEVGNRKVKAYMYENPEVKPFFQEAANYMLGDLERSVKGEKWFNGDLYYETNGEQGWGGTTRETASDIAYLLDNYGYTYEQIRKGLNAIIEDNGAENNAVSKRIEFLLHERLANGWTDFFDGAEIPPNQGYIRLLEEKQIAEYNDEARQRFFEDADRYAPPLDEDIAPVTESAPTLEAAEDIAPTAEEYEAITPKKEKPKYGDKLIRVDKATQEKAKIAAVLDAEPKTVSKKSRAWAKFKANVFDKGAVFEDLSLKTKNRELMGKWNFILSSDARAQHLIGSGAEGVKSLNDIIEEVGNTGKTKQFYEYLYHKHNIDRMSLAARYEGATNKAVFGDSVTAEVSMETVAQLEAANPEFKQFAEDVYAYNNHLRNLLVENGVISQETADTWAEMYPSYVPIRRAGEKAIDINVPLDTGRTTVNAPIKQATGGNSDILPLFDTMAMRTMQTYKAIAKNSFGVELKNTLGTTIESQGAGVDEVIDSIDQQDGLLKKGENGRNPTFTVFENGEKVTYEISEDMYDALKPASEGLSVTIKPLNAISNFHRGVLTEYNPVFMLTNAVKDVQDVFLNSQHPMKTYLKLPEAVAQLMKKGYWYQEYMENGGEQNTYFEKDTNTIKKEQSKLRKIVGFPLDAISAANNFIERLPRLAEYIASREAGRSVEVSMLDAARVTTNFAAGGDITKFLNRNGATFLNASVQGARQQWRNIREATANGKKGWVNLATKFALAGIPAMILNSLMWDDDEEYEELSDYVKQNYYIVGKYGDGQFVRIPKGRAMAVIQSAFELAKDWMTGDDEVDYDRFLDVASLAMSNLAPNDPIENNIFSPIAQVASNTTWYGGDLVPTRLQDLPAAEQYDESTDDFSRWLGEKLNYSPYKINYLLDQYTGGVGDTILPMLTPEAESGDNSLGGNLLAPLKSKFTTDSVMNNQNVSDFYDKMDELATNAKGSQATDEDVLKYKYINSVNADLSELYAMKREIQNSDLPDDRKYAKVRDIQEEINALARESLSAYNNVSIGTNYAVVGDREYKRNSKGEWQKISDKESSKQEDVTSKFGISASDYWRNKSEYDFAYEYPGKYAVSKAVGGYESYKTYASDLYDIKADKDENGKTISGSRKNKVLEYINNLDADYGEKIILFKSEYPADDTYNTEIVEYLNDRDDISYEDMVTILTELGFKVNGNNVTWD